MNGNNVKYFHNFEVEYILKEIEYYIVSKGLIASIFRIQDYNLIICWYFRIGFIDFMFKFKNLLDFTNFVFTKQL